MALVIYFTFDPDTDFSKLEPKRWPGLFLALLVSFLRLWAAAARIRFLSDTSLSWMASFRIMLTWDFTSSITPSTIGGAPMATYAMTKERISLGQSTAITLFSILLDQILFALIIPLLFVAGFFYVIIPASVGTIGTSAFIAVYVVLLLYAGLLSYSVFINPGVLRKFIEFISKLPGLRKFESEIQNHIYDLEKYSEKLRIKPFGFIGKAFLLTLGSWLARISLPTIVILSLLPANEILSLLRSVAMNLAFFIVPTPGGSGGVEGLFTLFQAPLIDRKVFVGIALFVWRFISYYITIGLGIVAVYWYINQSIRDEAKNTDGKLDNDTLIAPAKQDLEQK